MKMGRVYKVLFTGLLIILSFFGPCGSASAQFIINSQVAVSIELVGYNGLSDNTLFKGSISSGENLEIDISYRGLALLVFKSGQSYPVIIGDEPLVLKISSLDVLPAFTVGSENDYFYKALSGNKPIAEQYDFALLMIQAKQLLVSTHDIHTTQELADKKNQIHHFVRAHYEKLKSSDMVRRLIAQYFMMHEYVNYHTEGAPATDIRLQYQKAILGGVGSWLEILKSHVPEHEIINYCVALYYNRSMVTLASLIIENYRSVAYCPGNENSSISFSDTISVTSTSTNTKVTLGEIKGKKTIAFVSDECPVSMVETVNRARKLVDQHNGETLIVAPLQATSEKYLVMGKMISGGKMLFIDDAAWRKEALGKPIKLPMFQEYGNLSN